MIDIKVLSLFDGISCGQLALQRIGIKNYTYYASEIEKEPIKVTQYNHPNTIQLGDVTKVSYKDGILYTENGEFEVGEVDLVIGGSPCTGFSQAGKGLNFNDPQSKLFFEFNRILKEVNPKYFLLENVKMKKEHEDVITELVEVEPIEINSNLVSAQNRRRLYWTNVPINGLPEDKGLLIEDILTDKTDLLTVTEIENDFKNNKNYILNKIKSYNHRVEDVNFNKRGLRPHRGDLKKSGISELGCLHGIDIKSYTIISAHAPKLLKKDYTYRVMNPIECERLQTLPDNYTSVISDTQRLKAIGNGWTVDVISHILSGMEIHNK